MRTSTMRSQGPGDDARTGRLSVEVRSVAVEQNEEEEGPRGQCRIELQVIGIIGTLRIRCAGVEELRRPRREGRLNGVAGQSDVIPRHRPVWRRWRRARQLEVEALARQQSRAHSRSHARRVVRYDVAPRKTKQRVVVGRSDRVAGSDPLVEPGPPGVPPPGTGALKEASSSRVANLTANPRLVVTSSGVSVAGGPSDVRAPRTWPNSLSAMSVNLGFIRCSLARRRASSARPTESERLGRPRSSGDVDPRRSSSREFGAQMRHRVASR